MGPETAGQQNGAEFNNPVEAVALETQPDLRQQDKVIKYFETGDRSVIRQHEVYVGESQRSEFRDQVASGQIDKPQLRDFLLEIKPPVADEDDPENPVGLFQHVAFDHQQRGILAQFSKGDFAQRDQLTARDLGHFLQRYPEPIGFEVHAKSFLDGIERSNSAAKRAEYESSMKGFERAVYGKRQEYWEQIQLLTEQKTPTRQEVVSPVRPELPRMSPERTEQMLSAAEIRGDAYKGRMLNVETLRRAQLEPKYEVRFEHLSMGFSDIYESNGDRKAVVGYTQTADGRVTARTYYLSRSAGLWRYLPSYGKDDGWFDKGYSEESLNLPIEAQALLGQLSRKDYKTPEDGQLIFYGTARDLGHAGEATYQAETDREFAPLKGNFYPHTGERRMRPETMDFYDQTEAPDFSVPLAQWELNSSQYGLVRFEAYASHDGHLRYMIGRDKENRAWVAGVENNSRVMSTGIRQSWKGIGDLGTPLYEYASQSGGYGGKERGPYLEMWTNYLSKVPVIRRYRSAKGLS